MRSAVLGDLHVRPVDRARGDFEALIGLLAELGTTPGSIPGMNLGEINWIGYRTIDPPLDETAAVIESEAGALVGCVWLEPWDEFAVTIGPAFAISARQRSALTAYALEELRLLAPEPQRVVGTARLRSDAAAEAVLRDLGFTTDGAIRHHTFRHDFGAPITALDLPPGFRFQTIERDEQVAERSAVHLSVWPTSAAGVESYRMVRQAPLYRSDLDLVVEAADGTYAAFVLGWLETERGVVQFEPIGARAEYRRMGLTRALVQEGLRRARELGARVAYINCSATNEAGNALYRAVGCDLVGEWEWWYRDGA